jgi:hypothetical protein
VCVLTCCCHNRRSQRLLSRTVVLVGNVSWGLHVLVMQLLLLLLLAGWHAARWLHHLSCSTEQSCTVCAGVLPSHSGFPLGWNCCCEFGFL